MEEIKNNGTRTINCKKCGKFLFTYNVIACMLAQVKCGHCDTVNDFNSSSTRKFELYVVEK